MRILSLRSGFCLLYSVIPRWISMAHSTAWRLDPKLTITIAEPLDAPPGVLADLLLDDRLVRLHDLVARG